MKEDCIWYQFEEKTYNIQKDVSLIYSSSFSNIVKGMQGKTDFDISEHTLSKPNKYSFLTGFTFYIGNSSEFKSRVLKNAHRLKPCEYICGCFTCGSSYFGNKNLIVLSLNFSAMDQYIKYGKVIKNEINPVRVKATIAHELSHWADDAFYSVFSKTIYPNNIISNKNILKGKTTVSFTYYEIQAQIHGIEAQKKALKKLWDDITVPQLFSLYPVLNEVARRMIDKDPKGLEEWLQALLRRMSREGLLGNRMLQPFVLTDLCNQDFFNL